MEADGASRANLFGPLAGLALDRAHFGRDLAPRKIVSRKYVVLGLVVNIIVTV